MRTVVLMVSLLVLALPARAMDDNGLYVIHGETSCEAFLADRDAGRGAAYEWWVAGWLSALNFQSAETYDILAPDTDQDDVMLWLEDYCKEHGAESLAEGAVWLFRGLHPSRRQHAPRE